MKTTAKEAAILNAAQKIRERQQKAELATKVAEARKLVGNCYRYHNTYGGCDPREYWWLYMRVMSADTDGGFRALVFQIDCRGRIEFKPDEWYVNLMEGYQPITRAEFNQALMEAQKKVEQL